MVTEAEYRDWIRTYETLDGRRLHAARDLARELREVGPIDVAMPVCDPPVDFLRAAVESIREQIFENWRLYLVDDASSNRDVRRALLELERSDSRIRLASGEVNRGIAEATNAAVRMGNGRFVAFVDHDDLLPPHALLLLAFTIRRRPDANVIYSDFDFLGSDGERKDPFFKPDYDPAYHLGLNLTSHLTAYRRSLYEAIRGMRNGYAGSADYDLALRAVEASEPVTVIHIPHVLYHWRIVSTSVSRSRMKEAIQGARRAVQEHCERRGLGARLGPSPRTLIWNRVRLEAPALPTVSVFSHPEHQGIETAGDILRWRNEVMAGDSSDLIVFRDERCPVAEEDWLQEIVGHFALPDVAVVGGRVLQADGTLDHCGLALVRSEPSGLPVAKFLHGAQPRDSGYFGLGELPHRVECTTGPTLAFRREAALAVGGFFDGSASVALSDIDLCLKIADAGGAILLTPHVTSIVPPVEGASPDPFADVEWFVRRWSDRLGRDRCLNPNLSLHGADVRLAVPPRVPFPWQ